jgi:CPA1 family monovalent cation:H+ antiporter
MSPFSLFAIVIAIAAGLSFINYKFVGLPTTIGVMLIALGMSLCLIAADLVGLPVRSIATALLERLHFREVLLDGMLAFLLFAGALHVDLGDLRAEMPVVLPLATAGVLASTAIVGSSTWAVSNLIGLGLSLTDSFLFGALISPTDPIAVLAILRSAGAPKSLELQMAGESLFNDGIGVVVFASIAGLMGAGGVHHVSGAGSVVVFLLREVVGSLALGLVVGWLVYLMLRSVDNYQVEVLMTLALAIGLYALASALGTSGPLAVVVAGLLIGNHGRARAMSERTVEQLDSFWELIDEILNVTLFVLIGFEVLVIQFSKLLILAGLIAIVLVLAARFASVGATVAVLRRSHPFPRHAVTILSWGGLRGGISVALALSLGPEIPGRDVVLAMTYLVVVFSIAVQGLTVGSMVKKLAPATASR